MFGMSLCRRHQVNENDSEEAVSQSTISRFSPLQPAVLKLGRFPMPIVTLVFVCLKFGFRTRARLFES